MKLIYYFTFVFIETLGIEIIAGQSFSRNILPKHQIILNEAAVAAMGIEDPVGKKRELWGDEKQIMGVARNSNFESLYENVKPCIIQVSPNSPNVMVKIKAGTEEITISEIKKLFQQQNPGLPFDFKFLDQDYQELYASEQRVGILASYFAAIAIVISCLGLFGLAAFTAERRLKEISIRKILGSSEMQIAYLLSGDFTKMVTVAILIAIPASYFIAENWLDNFAYRISLKVWYFAAAGLSALFIAWLTVGVQTIKAARANPTQSLKSE